MPNLTLYSLIIATIAIVASNVYMYRAGVIKLDAQTAWQAAIKDPKRYSLIIRAYIGLAIGMLFGIVALAAMVVHDMNTDAPCRQACEQAGYADGLVRPSPYLPPEARKQDPPACWCTRDNQWSAEAVPFSPK